MGGIVISKDMVREALAELRVNRPRYLANRHIRNLLRTYGGGATNIGELNPELYFAVFVAAGALGPVCAPVQRGREPCDNDRTPAPHVVDPHGSLPRPSASFTSARIRSPLTIDLEFRLAARAGKPRSKPTMHVDYGSPAHFGDQQDDVVRDFPAGERVR
jgi:hypothetical protein